jgi:ligand-binding sensor domain-containing protein
MYRIQIIILAFLFLIVHAESQQHVGQWKSFTDMKSVRGAVQVNGNIWAATGGGVFVFDTAKGTFTKFTNVDGLDTNDVFAIAYDGTHSIWIGEEGGWVNVYDINTNQWQTIADIANRTEPTRKGIQSFSFKGDTVFIVTEFGVSVFRRSRWEFEDTYLNVGFISPQVSCMALQQNRIWIGTDKGLAVSSLGSELWTTYNSFPGITSSAITALAVFNDALVVGTATGAAYFALNDTTPKAIPLLNSIPITDLRIINDKLYILSSSGSNFTVKSLTSILDIPQSLASNTDVQGVSIVPSSSLWVVTPDSGFAQSTSSGWKYLYPNGPNSNFFNSLVVDQNGVLWCGSGETSPAGFYRYNASLPDTKQWKNFTSANNHIMWQYNSQTKNYQPFDFYYKVSLGANGSVWACSWGDGLVEVVADTIRRKLNYYSAPNLLGAGTGNLFDYVVGGGVAVDGQGKTWITTRSNFTATSLLRLDSDTDTIGTFFLQSSLTDYINFHDIVIDANDTKWIATTVPWKMEDNRLDIFNENGTVAGTQQTNGWTNLSTSDGLLSNIVLSLAIDLDGEIWAGTSLGVVINLDPLRPKSYSTSFPLQEQIIQAIAVDAMNNKWIGTKEGIFVVNADGTQQVQSYTVSSTNKSLLSNDIRSIAIDQKRGIAYFGTEQGLSSLAINAIQTNRAYSKLECGPNPFILPNDQPLTIRNLVANSTIKIMTVSGSVVKQFDAQGGGRAFWDGRDKNGAFVASGIYFIVASAENGSQTVTGKVAVIRH